MELLFKKESPAHHSNNQLHGQLQQLQQQINTMQQNMQLLFNQNSQLIAQNAQLIDIVQRLTTSGSIVPPLPIIDDAQTTHTVPQTEIDIAPTPAPEQIKIPTLLGLSDKLQNSLTGIRLREKITLKLAYI